MPGSSSALASSCVPTRDGGLSSSPAARACTSFLKILGVTVPLSRLVTLIGSWGTRGHNSNSFYTWSMRTTAVAFWAVRSLAAGVTKTLSCLMKVLEIIVRDAPLEKYHLAGMRAVTVHWRGAKRID